VPELLRTGADVTVVTYGASYDIALEAALTPERVGIDLEIVDVRTLLPFDTGASIRESIRKTSRVLFLDEDCPKATPVGFLRWRNTLRVAPATLFHCPCG
jgi:pyruvate/2-oxoglutarate/acetoin dehydrogenase E1 component